ncbi:MAG: bifunctional oligoribonuclease/PAP phosphatase NrnA [Gemmatimonadota bacterium]|nr:bifunctional oligoribonuclease/PAP phosphatase NrnA [Gemmatimonadota bacterium]
MSPVDAPSLAEAFEGARTRLEAADRLVLTTHVQPDGDGIGSEAALARVLRARGKRVEILNPHPTPRRFRFLEPDPPISTFEDTAAGELSAADLLVVLDIAVPERLGSLEPWIRRIEPETLILDHHAGPGGIPGFEVRDEGAAATGEMVYRLLDGWGGVEIDDPVATALYAAIAYDTGGFRYENTTAATHEIAADLVRSGADIVTVHRWLFESVSLSQIRLHARVLENLNLSDGGRVAWATIPLERMKAVGAEGEDVEGLVEALRRIEGVGVALLFKELEGNRTKVSLRSKGEADVQTFASRFGGGGHRNASGAMIEEPLDEVVDRVVPAALETFEPGEGR